jgi:hypothetical protein
VPPGSGRSAIPSDPTQSTRKTPVFLPLITVVLAQCLDIFRISLHSDDFIFLDAARRFPVLEVFLGQHGIYPWFRPLSRELLFYGVLAAGPYGHYVAQAIGLATVCVTTISLYLIARRIASHSAAVTAAVLLACCSMTKFLAAWASGYQDTLSTCLIVAAVCAVVYERPRPALVLAALAPLAKETGFLVFPVLGALQWFARRKSKHYPTWRTLALAASIPAALHVLARLTWHMGGSSIHLRPSLSRLGAAFAVAAGSFLPTSVPSWTLLSVACAVAGAVAVVVALGLPPREEARASIRPWFAVYALALSAAPLVVGHLARRIQPNAYYLYPAIPWLCVVLGWGVSRLPGRAVGVALALLVAIEGIGNAYRPANLNQSSAWVPDQLTWRETIRRSAIAERLSDDVRRGLAARTDSLVVLYYGLPYGAFFQPTSDGPSTRVALGDPTVRAYYVSQAPTPLDENRLAILAFDRSSYHLRPVARAGDAIESGMESGIATDHSNEALAWYAFAPESIRAQPRIRYLRAASDLLLRPVSIDSSSPALPPRRDEPDRATAWIAERLHSGEAHLEYADSLFAWNMPLPAASEYRLGIVLGKDTAAERLKLGLIFSGLSLPDYAVPELQTAVARGSPTWAVDVAQRALADLKASE